MSTGTTCISECGLSLNGVPIRLWNWVVHSSKGVFYSHHVIALDNTLADAAHSEARSSALWALMMLRVQIPPSAQVWALPRTKNAVGVVHAPTVANHSHGGFQNPLPVFAVPISRSSVALMSQGSASRARIGLYKLLVFSSYLYTVACIHLSYLCVGIISISYADGFPLRGTEGGICY